MWIMLQIKASSVGEHLGPLLSNLWEPSSVGSQERQDKLRDMGIVDILHKLSQSPDSNLCDKWVSKWEGLAVGDFRFLYERIWIAEVSLDHSQKSVIYLYSASPFIKVTLV